MRTDRGGAVDDFGNAGLGWDRACFGIPPDTWCIGGRYGYAQNRCRERGLRSGYMNHRPATKSASTLSNTRSYRADRPMVVGDDRSSHAARSSATMVAHSDGGIRMR